MTLKFPTEFSIRKINSSNPYPGIKAFTAAVLGGITNAPGVVVGAPLVRQISVDDRYFDVFGVPVLTGRGFRSDEFDSASRAILIDETFARNTFGDSNPLGRRLSYLSPAEATAADVTAAEIWYEIVGVVADRPSHPYRGSVFHPAAPGGGSRPADPAATAAVGMDPLPLAEHRLAG